MFTLVVCIIKLHCVNSSAKANVENGSEPFCAFAFALLLTQCYNFDGDVDADVKCEQNIKVATLSRRSN